MRVMKKKLSIFLILIFLFSIIYIIALTSSKDMEPIHTKIKEITVVTDDDYAPYSFRDENGYLKGLIVDKWNLWSIKTGVKVTIDGTSWQDAINKLDNDEYDVIETLYKTKDRAEKYNFSEPYAKSELQIFFNKDLVGITDVQSLKGFNIGVKKGDVYIDLLKKNGINDYIEFDKWEHIVNALKHGEINAFIMDKPPALYYLYKHNMQDTFKFTPINYKNNLYRGIKKENTDIFELVNTGFSRISDAENKQLQEKWFGTMYPVHKLSSYIKILLLTILSLLIVLFVSSRMFKRIIKEKTVEIIKNENKINAIVKTIPDLFFIINKDGIFVDYHTNDINNFFFHPDEFLNKTIYDLFNFSDNFIKSLKNAINQTLITGEIEILEYTIPFIEDFNFYESRIIRYDDDHILAVIRDITNEKATAMKIYDMSVKDVFTGLYNRNYFEKELNKIKSENLSNNSLIVCDLDGLKFINDTLGHHTGDEYLIMATQIITEAFGKDGSIISRTGGDEFVVLLSDTSESEILEMLDRSKHLIGHINKSKNLIIPISISMGYAISGKKTRDIRELLKEADDIMYRHKLHNKHSSKRNVMIMLKKALENKDHNKSSHWDRLEFLSIELAKSVGIKDIGLPDISLLAKFHDFGKIGISDKILLKPGRLNAAELQEAKRHSEIGYRIAQSYPEITHIANWILYHHEWWNGSGYPIGLSGEEIPVQCRILSITDAYDAMTNDSPYRKALSKEKAIDELKKYSGIQFDPTLVLKFIEIVSKLD